MILNIVVRIFFFNYFGHQITLVNLSKLLLKLLQITKKKKQISCFHPSSQTFVFFLKFVEINSFQCLLEISGKVKEVINKNQDK
jgi:hypothetical protein